ncbi:hypothetical protein [Bacillus salipaludis]|uniref:hypothetical protein n=1 Tax=Bacillus salipaludis TaxID=2547811 RepID=UPI002E22CC58|nr:hypothetical protein [Bacillus salipaludis]
MKVSDFRKHLSMLTTSDKSVVAIISKCLSIERKINIDLDDVVVDEEKTYQALLKVQTELNDKSIHGVYQNALRKYYFFINGFQFPSIKTYEQKKERSHQ